MSVSMLQIKKMLPRPTKSRMSEKYKDGLRQSWGASTNNEETMGSSLCQWIQTNKSKLSSFFVNWYFGHLSVKPNFIDQC